MIWLWKFIELRRHFPKQTTEVKQMLTSFIKKLKADR